ncbi:MAG: hypothetical protein HKM98_01675 [Gammaproteobacteria bacterium]|nr:hypothetical protein [Gammaproteobacteria bacterium]
MIDDAGQIPWHRQFWPWFVISLLASAVTASLATVWIAFAAAPERVDGADKIAIPVEWSANRLSLDLGVPPDKRQWPNSLRLTISDQLEKNPQQFNAVRVDDRHFETRFVSLDAGVYLVKLETDDSSLVLHGRWSYPAPVWKMEFNE